MSRRTFDSRSQTPPPRFYFFGPVRMDIRDATHSRSIVVPPEGTVDFGGLTFTSGAWDDNKVHFVEIAVPKTNTRNFYRVQRTDADRYMEGAIVTLESRPRSSRFRNSMRVGDFAVRSGDQIKITMFEFEGNGEMVNEFSVSLRSQ